MVEGRCVKVTTGIAGVISLLVAVPRTYWECGDRSLEAVNAMHFVRILVEGVGIFHQHDENL